MNSLYNNVFKYANTKNIVSFNRHFIHYIWDDYRINRSRSCHFLLQ